jgi:hypothetical protein
VARGYQKEGSNQRIHTDKLNAEIFDVSGAAIQVGGADVYIGGGHLHDKRRRGSDIGNGANAVVSGVTLSGFRPTSSDPGSAVVVHDDGLASKFYDNVILSASVGIAMSGTAGHIVDGNSVQALEVGIALRNTANIVVADNDIAAPLRVARQGGVTGTVRD